MKDALVLLTLVVLVGLLAAPALADWGHDPDLWISGLDTPNYRQPIWDYQFASWIDQYFVNGYSSMAFELTHCYSGGFIDYLQAFDNVVIATAADYDYVARYEQIGNPPVIDDYSTRWLNFIDNNDPGDTFKAAHDTASLYAPDDKPQYYSSPADLGDTYRLSGNGELSRHAVLFTGAWYTAEEKAHVSASTEKMFDTLVNDYGYAPGDIDILFGDDPGALNVPGAVVTTAYGEDLQTTMARTGAELDADGQFFFWTYTHGVYGEIPEPATMALLALGGIAALRRRSR